MTRTETNDGDTGGTIKDEEQNLIKIQPVLFNKANLNYTDFTKL